MSIAMMSALLAEPVSDTFYGLDVVISELLTDFTDVNIYGPVDHVDIISPDPVQQSLPILHLSLVCSQVEEKFELTAGQLKVLLSPLNEVELSVDLLYMISDYGARSVESCVRQGLIHQC